MSKTVSARIPGRVHDNLIEKCNRIGCTVNEYLIGAIELALDGSTDQELGLDVEESQITKQQKETQHGKVTKIIDDNGNVIYDSTQNKN